MVKIAWDLLLALWICVAAVILERRTNIQSQRVTSLYSGKSKSTNTADKRKNVKLGEYGRLDSWILSQSIWQRIWKGGNWGSIRGVFFPTSSTLRRHLRAALQHRYKVLHKHGTQQRSTASSSIKQLIPTQSVQAQHIFSLCAHFYPLAFPNGSKTFIHHFWGSFMLIQLFYTARGVQWE